MCIIIRLQKNKKSARKGIKLQSIMFMMKYA